MAVSATLRKHLTIALANQTAADEICTILDSYLASTTAAPTTAAPTT